MNAFTSKEYTCYYARVLDQDLPIAIDKATPEGKLPPKDKDVA